MTDGGDLATGLIGDSESTRRTREEVARAAKIDAPVLILGETGTGKEVVARSIYESNPRGAFVTVDCSGLMGTLLESELFGHVRGSFTGAVTSKKGLLGLADRGVAFLDEVGELPLEFQAKLLRVLQFKEFRPVGALEYERSDFRVIAATNRDLEIEVDRGTFRRDLYFRLQVLVIRLKPLRERRDDIPALVQHFLLRHSGVVNISGGLMEALVESDWPGNVRELENCVRRLVMMSGGDRLEMGHLDEPVERKSPSRENHPVTPLAELEQRAIEKALEHTGGDRSAAARLLGIGRTTLYRRLRGGHRSQESEVRSQKAGGQ